MSFDINWSELENDSQLNEFICNKLNSYLSSIHLPSYVRNLKIAGFKFGETAPKVILRQISDPLQEFYDAINSNDPDGSDNNGDFDEENSIGYTPKEKIKPSPNDIQFLTEVEYRGDLLITLNAELVLNYPSENFMALPVKLTVSKLGFHSLCITSYLSKQLFFSFLCDVSDAALDNDDLILDTTGPAVTARRPLERISIIRSMSVHTEIGEQYQQDGSILRSVGKLEQFLLEKLKDFLRKEVAWPSWINLDFSELEDDE